MEKLKEIIDGIRDNKFLLPNFQREFVWNFKQQKDLIASVISSVPASSSLLVEEENFKNPKFDCIKVGQRSSKLSIEHQKPFYYILDGQQRFTTLYYAFTNAFNSSVADNEATFKRLDNKLKVRWFLKFESESGFLFNYDTLIFNKEHFEKYLPNDLFDFISEEKILINSIRKEADSYTQHLKSESLSDNKIPLHLFLMEDDESYRLKEWLKEIQQDRISNLKNKSENKSSLVKLFEFFSLDEPNKIADALYQDEETAIKVFEDCVKNVKVDNWHDKVYNYIKDKIKDYEIKPIVLDDMFKAISTFEYINTRGTDLSTFDLLCAKAGTTFDLRKKVIERSGETFDFYNNNFDDENDFELKEHFGLIDSNDKVQKQYAEYLAQVFNLLYYKKKGGIPEVNSFNTSLQKAKYSLDNLEADFLEKNYEKAVDVIKQTSAILQTFCAHKNHKKIQNKLILIPIFTFFVYKDENKITPSEIRKIIAFFWIKLLSGQYDAHQSEAAKKHSILIYNWLIKKDKSITDELKEELNNRVLKVDEFANKDMLTTQKCGQSIEENIFMLLRSLNRNFYDWDSHSSIIEVTDDVQIHHIIPLFNGISNMKQSTKELRKDNENILNATMNKTPITKTTNQNIGAKSPNQYVSDVNPQQIAHHFINDNWFKPNPNKTDLFENRYDAILGQFIRALDDYLT